MAFKTLFISLILLLAAPKKEINIRIVNSEKSKDSSTEKIEYTITPGSIAYARSVSGRKKSATAKVVDITKSEFKQIEAKFREFNLAVDMNETFNTEAMYSTSLILKASLDKNTVIKLSGEREKVRENTTYSSAMKFINWLQKFKSFDK